MRIFICGCLVACLLSGCQTDKGDDVPHLAINNAIIIDVETGDLTSGRTVLVDSAGVITLSDDQVEAKTTIDARGRYIMPALWDMHVHFRGGDSLIDENRDLLPLFIANGVTTVRDAGGDLTQPIFTWRKQISDGSLIGPYLYTSGPKIDGPGARWAGSLEVSNTAEADKALDSLAALGVDFVKLYDSRLSEEMYLYLLEACRDRGMKVSGHMPFTVMLQDAIDREVTSIEHLYYVLKGCSSREAEITDQIRNGELGFWGSMELLMDSYSDSIAEIRFEQMKDAGVYVVPTLHIGHVLSYPDQNDHAKDEELALIGEGIRKTYEGRIQSAARADSAAILRRHRLHHTFRKLAVRLQKSGVRLLAGSDAGAYNSYVYPGYSLHEELRIMAESGMTPLEALQTATINAAAYFELNPQTVKIQNGSSTDLLILSKNPLEVITNTTTGTGLVLDGNYIDLEKFRYKLTQ